MDKSILPYAETVEQEVAQTLQDMRLSVLLRHAFDNNTPIPEELRSSLQDLILTLNDMFSTSVPVVDGDPDAAIRAASRDLRFALLLRERGIARVVRLSRELGENGLPLYSSFDSGFQTQEDFLKWFCGEFKISRALVFMRKGTYEKLLGLGLTMEQAFEQVIRRPYLVREALNLDKHATWDNGNLVDIDPAAARRIGNLLPQGDAEHITALANVYEASGREDDREALCEAMRPAMLALVDHVANHESARGARELINIDVLDKPEITYTIDPQTGNLTVELVEKATDSNGNEFISKIRQVVFLPDAPEVPRAILLDLVERLPVRGKNSLVI